MQQKIKSALLILFWSFSFWAVSQSSTDIELHNRYWANRENFRKYFSVIGYEPGGGLPFSDLTPNSHLYNEVVTFNSTTKKLSPAGNITDIAGKINIGGDVTAFMAE